MERTKLPEVFERFDLAISHHRESIYRVRLDDSPDGRRSAVEVDFDRLPVWCVDEQLLGSSASKVGVSRHIRVAEELSEDPRAVGEQLFRAVFSGIVGAAFRASVRAVRGRRGVGLRVRLALDDAPRLAGLPWEALWDSTEGAFLSDQPYLVVVRTLRIAEPVPQFGSAQLATAADTHGLLALLPEPQGEDPWSGADEWGEICESLESLIEAGELEESRVEPATLPSLRQHMDSHPCHVLHVVAHGLPGDPGHGGVLCLENAQGGSDEVRGSELLRVLAGEDPPRLVVLNVCFGATNSETDPFDGLAQTLLRRGVAAVVAMRSSISDAAAVLFATTFYHQLAKGRTVEAAMVASRRALGTSEQRNELINPVLYLLGDNVALVKGRCRPGRSSRLGLWRRVGLRVLAGAATLSLSLGFLGWFSQGDQGVTSESATQDAIEPMAPTSLDPPPICPAPPGFHDLEFVKIDPGVATIDGQPRTVEKAFCISTKEISRRDWLVAMGGELHQRDWFEDWPMTQVSLENARGFADRLGQLQLGVVFRLPTPNEWLLAAAAGAETPYFFGESSEELHLYGNCFNFFQNDKYDGPAPVGSFRPNQFGLFDVHGNVAEWVEAIDIKHEGHSLRLGGSYLNVRHCRLDKDSWVQAKEDDETGFRIVQELSPITD